MSAFRIFCLVTIGILMVGCVGIPSITTIRGSGRTETKSLDLAGFTKLNVSSAFTVDVTQSETYKVEITVDDNLVERLDVRVSGDTLYVGLKPGTSMIGSATMKAQVTMPELTDLKLSGATSGAISGFSSGKSLDVEVSGASKLKGDIACGDARFEVSGASRVELTGAAQDLRVVASGASTAALDGFPAVDVEVEASGASRATVNVSGKLRAKASGASTVLYTGDPNSVVEDASGASTVKSK